jgi:hypothetical protein
MNEKIIVALIHQRCWLVALDKPINANKQITKPA